MDFPSGLHCQYARIERRCQRQCCTRYRECDKSLQHLAREVSIELVFGNVASREVATAKAASYSDSSECQVAIFFSFRLWTFAVLKSTAMIVGTYQITHNSSFCECGVSPFAPAICDTAKL
jgi:hypothetical protein